MQIFKAFFLSLKSQSRAIIIYFIVLAVIEGLLCSFLQNETYDDFTKTKIDIAVFDHDNTQESKALYDYLADSQNIVTIKDDKEEITDELFNRNVTYVLTIKEGFSKDFTLLENIKQPDSSAGYFIDHNIDQFLKILNTYQSSGYSTTDSIRLTRDSINKNADVTMSINDNGANTSRTTAFFRYLPYFFISILVTSLGNILGLFRKKDISARIQCSSISIMKRNLWMTFSSIVFGLILLVLVTIYGAILTGSDFFQMRTLLFIFNALICMIFSLLLTLLISFFIHTENTLNLIANLIGLGLSFLGGVFVPLEILSPSVKSIAHFLPTYWYVMANSIASTFDGSMTQFTTFLSYIGIQCLFILGIFAFTLASSKAKKTA